VAVHTRPRPTAFPYQDLLIQVDPEVYDPAEDTYLLLDSLHPHPKEKVLEIGTGCGIIALSCAKDGADVVASDCNPHAVRNCRHNIEQNKARLQGSIEVRLGDLFTVVQPDERFDLILFNPPYVPTAEGESVEPWLDTATGGGPDGLQVTSRFITEVRRFLTPTGQTYIIVSSQSPPEAVSLLLRRGRLDGCIVGRHRLEDEEIRCYRLTPAD